MQPIKRKTPSKSNQNKNPNKPAYEPTEENFWLKTSDTKQCDYKLWKEFYIKDYRVNIVEVVYLGEYNNHFIQLTLGDILDMGIDNPQMAEHIRRIAMKNGLTGRNPSADLRAYIDQQLKLNNTWLIKRIS